MTQQMNYSVSTDFVQCSYALHLILLDIRDKENNIQRTESLCSWMRTFKAFNRPDLLRFRTLSNIVSPWVVSINNYEILKEIIV